MAAVGPSDGIRPSFAVPLEAHESAARNCSGTTGSGSCWLRKPGRPLDAVATLDSSAVINWFQSDWLCVGQCGSFAGYVSATHAVQAGVPAASVFFWLDGPTAPANIAGDYTLSFVADGACADRLPDDIRRRTYLARIIEDGWPTHPAHTLFVAALSGATLDGYFNRMSIYVAGDYLRFDLSDNSILEEVEDDAYLSIGGVGTATVGTEGISAISGSLKGVFDYCVQKSEMNSGFHCDPAEATVHATCSGNHQVILTRR